MSSIYVYSPSGAVRDKAAFKRGIRRLEDLGFDLEIDPSALSSHERFAGNDKERIEAIKRAAKSGADLAMITRGGYGLSRILDALPYRTIAKAVESGTKFIGLSDFTAFQMALYSQTHTPSWAGPALLSDFGAESTPDEIMVACFEDLISERGEGTGWRISSKSSKSLLTKGLKARKNLNIENATLWGGNLSMICSLLGTAYFPSIKGGILFLEDIGEHPYRVERMLMQLYHSGVLGQQKAIILGSFTDYKLTPHDKGYNLKSVFEFLYDVTKLPVICDLPFGHVPLKVCLPFGQKVTLASQENEVFLFWNHHHNAHSHEH